MWIASAFVSQGENKWGWMYCLRSSANIAPAGTCPRPTSPERLPIICRGYEVARQAKDSKFH